MSIAGRAVGEWASGLMGYWAFFACAGVRAGGGEVLELGAKVCAGPQMCYRATPACPAFPNRGGLLLVPTSPLRQPYSIAVRSDRRPGSIWKSAKKSTGAAAGQAPLSK